VTRDEWKALVSDSMPKGYDARRGPDMPESECEVLDPTLVEFVGSAAWVGIAWRPKDRSHPYYDGLRELRGEWEREHSQRLVASYSERLPARYRRYSLENLRVHPGNRAAVDAAANLAVGSNVYVWGPAGNGKTHLAVATGLRLAGEGRRVAFWGVVELFNRTRASFGGGERPNIENPEVLILDDLGKVKPTEFVYEVFYGALEYRWANELTTIFTANHRPSAAAAHLTGDNEAAAAVLSRMASGVVVEVKGADERLPA
jgi:DNA replication protein DnaC